MPRKAKQYDVSTYTCVGEHHWTEISHGAYFDAGKSQVKPKLEFLHPDGHKAYFYNHDTQTYKTVTYDREYVMQYFYQKVVIGFGWEQSDGTIREDILKRFLDDFYGYCCSHTEAQKQKQIESQIQALIAATGRTEQEIREWMDGQTKDDAMSSLEPIQEVLDIWESKIKESANNSKTGQPSERLKATAQLVEDLKRKLNK